MILAKLQTNSFMPLGLLNEMDVAVERFSWMALGGPDRCSLRSNADKYSLGRLLNCLRAPLTLFNVQGVSLWWGYVSSVTLQVGAIEISLSLDDMANMVTVTYSERTETGGNARGTTAPVLDEFSVSYYGAKERRESLSQGTSAQALAIADALLAQRRLPIPAVKVLDAPVGVPVATVEGKGWWHTLAWRYYANGNAGEKETTEQIKDLVAAVAPFFTSVFVTQASGITTPVKRTGDHKADEELLDLLRAGGGDALRLLATVLEDRTLKVYPEPGIGGGKELLLTERGDLLDAYGAPLSPELCPVGSWMRVIDSLPQSINASVIGEVGRQFVEKGEYNTSTGRWHPEPRGTVDVWDLMRIE